MKKGFLYRLSLLIAPRIYSLLTRLLFATCRVEMIGEEILKELVAAGPVIGAFWHYGIYLIVHIGRRFPLVAMVSASTDGEYMSRLLSQLDIETVRGSRGAGKGGLEALRGMERSMKNGRSAAIVVDGSQGPARIVQPGAVILASRTGAPIVPVTWAANRYFIFKSWDRSILPLPFSRVIFYYGEPISVPPGVRGDELEEYRLELENRLNSLYEKAWDRFGRSGH